MINIRGSCYNQYFLYQDEPFYPVGWVRVYAKILKTTDDSFYISKVPSTYSYVSNVNKLVINTVYNKDISEEANIKYCDKIDELIIIKMFYIKTYHLAFSIDDMTLKQKIIDIKNILD